jgi:uncharacterized membrane protein
MSFLLLSLLSFLTMISIDVVWLFTMYKQFYGVHISHLLAEKPSLLPAVLLYLLYGAGITFFIVKPYADSSLMNIFFIGALFGLVAYGCYDLTNHATLKNWPVIVTIVDMLWGAVLTGTVSVIVSMIAKKWIG